MFDSTYKEGVISITGCVNCPFCYEYDMAIGYGCNAMKAKLGSNEYFQKFQPNHRIKQHTKKFIPITPDWCPLKSESLVLKMEK